MPVSVFQNAASFVARTVALAIDFALLAVMHISQFLLLAAWLQSKVSHFEPLPLLALCSSYLAAFFVSFVFLHLGYFTLFHAWSGQTIGKMIMGIKVVRQDSRRLTPAVAFLRCSGYILSSVPLASGFLWSAVVKDHCAWHDRLAQTRVVSAEMT